MSTQALLRGSSQPTSSTKPARYKGLKPGIRSKQKRLGRVPGLGHVIEKFAVSHVQGLLDPGKNARVEQKSAVA